MVIHVTNHSNGYKIEFCVGEKEYVLSCGKTVEIEVKDEDCMYFDSIEKES